MKITVVRRILREDLGSAELPTWVDSLLSPLNQFIDLVTLALRGNLTLETNISGTIFTGSFTSGVMLKINPKFKVKPLGVMPLGFGTGKMDSYGWEIQQDGTIGVTINFVGGGTYNSTIFIFPENV